MGAVMWLEMKLTDQQILEIVDNLDSGMRCFFNRKTGEIKTILNFDGCIGEDEEPFKEEKEEIEENWDDYYEFEGMSSHDSFGMMVDFAETIDNEELQDKLVDLLRKSKPFRNFKWQIDNSGEYRQKWFDYKKMCYIKFVKEQISN